MTGIVRADLSSLLPALPITKLRSTADTCETFFFFPPQNKFAYGLLVNRVNVLPPAQLLRGRPGLQAASSGEARSGRGWRRLGPGPSATGEGPGEASRRLTYTLTPACLTRSLERKTKSGHSRRQRRPRGVLALASLQRLLPKPQHLRRPRPPLSLLPGGRPRPAQSALLCT